MGIVRRLFRFLGLWGRKFGWQGQVVFVLLAAKLIDLPLNCFKLVGFFCRDVAVGLCHQRGKAINQPQIFVLMSVTRLLQDVNDEILNARVGILAYAMLNIFVVFFGF